MNQENEKKTFNTYSVQRLIGICTLVSIPFIFFYGLIAVNITVLLAVFFTLSVIIAPLFKKREHMLKENIDTSISITTGTIGQKKAVTKKRISNLGDAILNVVWVMIMAIIALPVIWGLLSNVGEGYGLFLLPIFIPVLLIFLSMVVRSTRSKKQNNISSQI